MSRRRPSPAMIVAMIALCLGLGGSAIAASDLTKKDVKKIAKKVANKQIKKKAILKKDEGKLNVNSAKTAGTAGAAATAGNVNGVVLTKVNFVANEVTGDTTIFSGGGLTLTASCAAGAELGLEATTSKADSSINVTVTDINDTIESDGIVDGNFDDESFDMHLSNDGNGERIAFVYDAPDGTAVTGVLTADENGTGGDCQVHGHVTS